MNIAIVIAEFNEKVTSRMHSVAIEKAKELKLNIKYTCKVPGIFDMPLIIDKLFILRRGLLGNLVAANLEGIKINVFIINLSFMRLSDAIIEIKFSIFFV